MTQLIARCRLVSVTTVVFCLLGGCSGKGDSDKKTPAKETSGKDEAKTSTQKENEDKEIREGPAVKVTSEQLVKDYLADKAATSAKYKGKVLEVEGEVEAFKGSSLHLKGPNEYRVLFCDFPKEMNEQLKKLPKGKKVAVRGKAGERFDLWEVPSLESCILK